MDLRTYGPWALITGGSEGIGASFARKLAAAGFNLVLIARKPAPLEALKTELEGQGVRVRILSVDLSHADAVERTRTVTDDIGLLIYNVGANAMRANILEMDPEVYRGVINITCLNQAEYVRHYGGLMLGRGRGGIILGGSSSNFLGARTLGPYTAAKAFSRIFTESLWAECQDTGIHVLHMVISYTDTPAMRRLGYDTAAAQSPDEVAQEALDNIANGPLLFLGGEKAFEIAQARSQLADRGALINRIATPRREEIAQQA